MTKTYADFISEQQSKLNTRGLTENDLVEEYTESELIEALADYIEILESYIDEETLNELSSKTLDSYHTKAIMSANNSVSALRKKSRAHATLGNNDEAKRLKKKASIRDAGTAKALARTDAQSGKKIALPGSAVDKASKKMPSSYNK